MESLQMVEKIHLSDYWDVIRKRKALIVFAVFITVAVTMAIQFCDEAGISGFSQDGDRKRNDFISHYRPEYRIYRRLIPATYL